MGGFETVVSDLFEELVEAKVSLRNQKPNDRSDIDRHFAVTITELEKVIAYFKTYVVDAFHGETD